MASAICRALRDGAVDELRIVNDNLKERAERVEAERDIANMEAGACTRPLFSST